MGRLFLIVRWSAEALAHALEKHAVTEAELAEMLGAGVVVREITPDRIAAYGETRAGRLLTAIIERREGALWGITARKMERRERCYYVEREGYDD